MWTLGTLVSLKYEVDESYWLIDRNDTLTAEQKQEATNRLDKKGKQLNIQAYALEIFAFATFVTATGLIIKRYKILGVQKSST